MARAAACVAVSLLTGLAWGLPVLAQSQAAVDPGFAHCRQSFYGGTPPRGFAGAGLVRRCHSFPGRLASASLYNSTCGSTVYSAFCLRDNKSWNEGIDDHPEPQVLVPALLGGEGSEIPPSAKTPLHVWEALIWKLIEHSASAQCPQAQGAALFVLTGASGLSTGEDGCEVAVFWSALCCAASGDSREPGESMGFSVGIVKEGVEKERLVSVEELEKATGVAEIFTGLCRVPGGLEDLEAVFQESLNLFSNDMQITDEQMDEIVDQAIELEEEPPENVTDSSLLGSTFMYLLSTSGYLITLPLYPVYSTLTSIPGQVTYVVQEDLAVLSSVPGDVFTVFENIACDTWTSAVSPVVGMVYGAGELCVTGLYCCTSPLVGTLLTSCQEGVTGAGTLALDGMSILGEILNSTWSISKFLGGKVLGNSEDYVESLASELGHQVHSAGRGVGKLAWRGGRGVGHVLGMIEWLSRGVVSAAVGNVQEALGLDEYSAVEEDKPPVEEQEAVAEN
uniref:INO80 complex subunit E n=1 Tax=Denticeps clupeoides TaxID=299321 RepID=A0AAY3ZY74_9TELE